MEIHHQYIDMVRLTRKAIHKARKQIASLINADPAEILITSGGTESNNTVLMGISSQFSIWSNYYLLY